MPLPEKQPDETRDRFIDRCMADVTMVREFPDAAQRRAVCERQADRPATANAGAPLHLVSEPGALTIEAAADGAGQDGKPRLPRFTMVAYTGGPMRIAGWRYPVVVDLAGLAIPSQARPIRFGHDVSAGVGHSDSIRVQDGRLIAAGVVSRDTSAAREIVASAKNGFPWQASIGASVDQFEFVKESQSVLVNGRELKGPINVVRKATLGEISFVDLGADVNTSASVAAQAKENNIMADNIVQDQGNDVKAAAPPPPPLSSPHPPTNIDQVIADGRRRQAIEAASVRACEAMNNDVAFAEAVRSAQEKALSDQSCTVATYEARLLNLRVDAITAGWRHNAGVGDNGARIIHSDISRILTAAAMISAGVNPETVARDLGRDGEQIVEAASRQYHHGIGLEELVLAVANANGYSGRQAVTVGNWKDVLAFAIPPRGIQAGFSTVDLSGILGAVANKAMARVAAEPDWVVPRLFGVVSHSNFHSHTVYSLAMSGGLEEVAPNGEIGHVGLGEESYTRQVKTRGAMLTCSRTDLVNDDLGAFTRMANGMARKAYSSRETVGLTKIMASGAGTSHFTAARGNYLTGADTAFSHAGLANAIAQFGKLKDAGGDYMGVTPRLLLVPPTLRADADAMVAPASLVIATGVGGAKQLTPNANIYAGRFQVLSAPHLEDSGITGNSAAYWYMFADPAVLPCYEVSYLNGQQSPTVEYFGLDTVPDILGVSWRVYWDLGLDSAEWRAGVKSAGA